MKNVVLADRNADTRRILGDYLGVEGWAVLPCDTAEELLSHVQDGRATVVVVELFDLGPGALALSRDIAAGRGGPAVPVLVYTSDPRRSLVREIDLPGMRLLSKPASPRDVLRALEALLGAGGGDVPHPGATVRHRSPGNAAGPGPPAP